MTQPFASIADAGSKLGPLAAAHIDATFRAILRGPAVRIDAGAIRLITNEPHPFGNFAMLADASDLGAASSAVKALVACGAPSAVLTTAPPSEALAKLLGSSGFERHAGLPGMAVDIDLMAATALPSGYTFVRMAGSGMADEWGEAFARGYELPLGVGRQFAAAIGDDDSDDAPMQYFAVRKGGRMVCTSVVHVRDGVAGIYAVATVPEERKKGLGAHATAEPLRRVHRLGYRVGVLQASEAGHHIYRRLGFVDVSEVFLYVRMPS